jgi:phosphate transport system substrate-binding protein
MPEFKRRAAALATAALMSLSLAACGSDYPLGPAQEAAARQGSSLSGTLTGAGASSQNAAMDAWVAGFGLLHSDAQVQYSPDGSGAGRTAFLAGAVEFAGSDAYLDDEEVDQSRKVCGPEGGFNVPSYISPITVAFNLPGITELNLDAETIARIFQGEIRSWDDPAIAEHNPDVELPDLAVTPVNRSEDSGTTETFTEYLHAVVPEVWTPEPSDTWPGEYAGENAQGTTGVVSMVAGTAGAVTYADDSAVGDPLGKVNLKVGQDYVPVSAEAAAKALDEAKPVEGRPEYDLALEVDRTTTAPGAYPLMLVSYHIYCTTYEDQEKVDLVKAFAQYVLSPDGQNDAADSAKSAPLSEELSRRAVDSVERISARS